ncbi:MAG: helix-turn-helix transcriptional regulator [Clostridia bacterium]|nr:helix-turn-helix transcriptional regulator [Clostridia bacterium]
MEKYPCRLRELREDRDLHQKEIAELLQTTQQYYSQYENGKRKLPIEHLITLCKFYNVSADYILGLPKGMEYPKR